MRVPFEYGRNPIRPRVEPRPPRYADDIASAKRRLFDLRMRKSQRLPFKSSEFRELRLFVARLKTRQREDELKGQGAGPRRCRVVYPK